MFGASSRWQSWAEIPTMHNEEAELVRKDMQVPRSSLTCKCQLYRYCLTVAAVAQGPGLVVVVVVVHASSYRTIIRTLSALGQHAQECDFIYWEVMIRLHSRTEPQRYRWVWAGFGLMIGPHVPCVCKQLPNRVLHTCLPCCYLILS